MLYLLYRVLFAPPAVQTGMMTRGNLITLVYATARVSADSLATRRSKSGGVAGEILRREGTNVTSGALLLRTDPSDERCAVLANRKVRIFDGRIENDGRNC